MELDGINIDFIIRILDYYINKYFKAIILVSRIQLWNIIIALKGKL